MALRELAVAGYRSVRDLRLPLRRVNVLTGPNGCGKSNLYNAVFLLARAAEGSFALALAEEGGMPSVLWAGTEGKRLTRRAPPRRVVIEVAADDFGYTLVCGLPQGGPSQGGTGRDGVVAPPSQFLLDPEIKEETVWLSGAAAAGQRAPAGTTRRVVFLQREGPGAALRDREGRMVRYPVPIDAGESILAQVHEPQLYPELALLRETLRRWRFYHHFRTDRDAPVRHPQVGVLTPVLRHDGADLAAALQTIVEIGDADGLAEAIDRA